MSPDLLAIAEDACRYTHVGMVGGATGTAEMIPPRARIVPWTAALAVGDRIRIVRPRGARRMGLAQAYVEMVEMAAARVKYPWRELLVYWLWSWPSKLAFGRHFADVFGVRRRDVCSGSVWTAWAKAHALPRGIRNTDWWPEAWYPARLAAPSPYLQRIADIEIVGDGDGAAAPIPARGHACPWTPAYEAA